MEDRQAKGLLQSKLENKQNIWKMSVNMKGIALFITDVVVISNNFEGLQLYIMQKSTVFLQPCID